MVENIPALLQQVMFACVHDQILAEKAVAHEPDKVNVVFCFNNGKLQKVMVVDV